MTTRRRDSGTPFLDNDGRILFGGHVGELVEDVATSYPSYLRWILSDTDICDEDAEIIREHLRRSG